MTVIENIPAETSSQLTIFLKSFPVFSNLDDDELDEIKKLAHKKKFRKGQPIFLEGEHNIPLYLVASGKLKAFKCASCDKEQIVRIVRSGDILCLTSLFCGSTCACVDAIDDSILYAVEKADMLRLLQQHPKIAVNFLQYFANHLKKLSNLIESLSLKDVTFRLTGLLLEHSVLNNKGESICPLTQKEMASFVGTVRELVGRSLKRMEEKGLIEVKYHEVVLLNPLKMKELLNFPA